MWHYVCKECAAKEPAKCEECEVGRFVGDCEAAIDLIAWYLNHYHHANIGHQEMITHLQSIIGDVRRTRRIADSHRRGLQEVERRVDSWLYQVI